MKLRIITMLVLAGTLTACTAAGGTSQEMTLTTDAQLQRVIDGDTLTVRWDADTHKVRILGIDAPEVPHPSYGKRIGEACGHEATVLTRKLVAGHRLTVTGDHGGDTHDKYGRTLAYVEANGHDVETELLTAGLAEQYHAARSIGRYQQYRTLTERASAPKCRSTG